jgi:hypothetical protein
MVFTKEELEAAYECALRYPVGCGMSYFSDSSYYRYLEKVVKRIAKEPECIAFG